MSGKRKRSKRSSDSSQATNKKEDSRAREVSVKENILRQYYGEVFTLREYLLSKLAPSSKIRRKRIMSMGRLSIDGNETLRTSTAIGKHLDETLIGVLKDLVSSDDRMKQRNTFSQLIENSVSIISGVGGEISQSEIVDFVIWLLFTKSARSGSRVQHLLCQGYNKVVSKWAMNRDKNPTSSIPGIVAVHQNSHVASLKLSPWNEILALLGKQGERVMIDLLLDCGVFLALESGKGNYYQLSGKPLGDLMPLESENRRGLVVIGCNPETCHTPATIIFVRNRMLYARAALNAHGNVSFGLRHIHVLNRLPLTGASKAGIDSTKHVLMYIFPRQFGLHNVFTHTVDRRETVQPFKDYTLREEEISTKYGKAIKIPKRLRGTLSLVKKMQILHTRCSYKELLDHYCPLTSHNARNRYIPTPRITQETRSTAFETQLIMEIPEWTGSDANIPTRKVSMMDHATPTAKVSAFCRAVLSKLVPNDFWGSGEVQKHNKHQFLKNVDLFVKLRRFESLSLHAAVQGMKINHIAWLASNNSVSDKSSHSDTQKRLELFHEFIYYLFDSLLIPLIRANFHVTESNIHRYRIFFYRHDIWKSLAEPALATLKATMFEEVKTETAQQILSARSLGFTQVRLLPKETGVRPIMNLRRRALKKGNKTLGSSINSTLAPLYNVLTYEKNMAPHQLGSALFSVGELYTKLKSFRVNLKDTPLYFTKLDVQAAFDTIPQAAVIRLIGRLPQSSEYRISKHLEVNPGDGETGRPIRKWASLATSPDDIPFEETLERRIALGKKNTVFVDNIVDQFRGKDELVHLLSEHIQHNMVKIGKKFYRQREGIPQGSVLSSLLCNYFYADLEAHHLSFLTADSLLLRLIDDFLLITTNQQEAKMFLEVMHNGMPEYGVTVNPAKTLTNFEASINGRKVERLVGTRQFPYCGTFIDTSTLNITKDRRKKKDVEIVDSLTVEFSKVPGKSFQRKVLNTFKIQAHAMFLDTSFNSFNTVLKNIYESFTETAMKMWKYGKCLPIQKQPSESLIILTIQALVDLAFLLLKSKSKKNAGYKCAVSKIQVEWLAMTAFKYVLSKRQTNFRGVVVWLEGRIDRIKGNRRECSNLDHLLST